MEDDAEKLVDTNDNMREDFTHLYTFTIDPPQSTDLDDAISIEKCPRKNHEDCYRVELCYGHANRIHVALEYDRPSSAA